MHILNYLISTKKIVTALAAGLVFSLSSFGAAIVPGFNSTSDGRNDDGTYITGGCNNNTDGGTCAGTPVPIGFNINFYGAVRNSLFINTNGNITLDTPLSTFTPFGLNSVPLAIIAPFFADVDTRNPNSGVVTFGSGTFDGQAAFGVNWINVGYYDQHVDKTNSFQLLLVNRLDTGAGNFDIYFNYDRIGFETGDASNGVGGLGGSSAYVGFSSGTGAPGTVFQLPGSGVPGSLIDGGSNALISHSLNSDVAGRYIFAVRNGAVVQPVPETSTLTLMSVGLLLLPLHRRTIRLLKS